MIESIVILIIYILVSIFLNQLNKQIYGKGTPMCWIPLANIYLLGKLAVNKIVGWLLIAAIMLTASYTITINEKSVTYYPLPEPVKSVFSKALGCFIFVLFIYAITKYVKLKKEPTNSEKEKGD